jgi:hypothetical protein
MNYLPSSGDSRLSNSLPFRHTTGGIYALVALGLNLQYG